MSATLETLGGTTTIDVVTSLEQLDGEVVVNCSGLGAAELVGDTSMFPIRGQTVALANPGITEGIADESDPERIAYAYPRIDEIVLGGTRDADDPRTEPDPAIAARIIADTAVLDPRLRDLEVSAQRVGFRPGRPEVRLESGALADGRRVVHNYGHGGAGFIMSWGCAADVVDLVGG